MQLKAFLITLRSSMWFIPVSMVVGAVVLAFVCLRIDDNAPADFARYYPQPFAGGADSIRMMLSAIATSMITVSGITFSLTISSLAQMSAQLTARVLRNFVSAATSKVVLGFFVSLFTYCLIVMRTIRIKDDAAGPFIPALSVFVAMGLAVIGVGMLIYFVHYVAHLVQASTVVSSVAEETLTTIDKLYPDPLPANVADNVPANPTIGAGQTALPVLSARIGYVQLIDENRLRKLAERDQLTIQVSAGTGDFVTNSSPLVTLIGDRIPVSDSATTAIQQAFSIRPTRTIDEEIAFGIRQLVDIALKSLSPASDDTTTAVLTIDYLSAVLTRLVQRQLQADVGTSRFIPKHPAFGELLDGALNQLRDMAAGNTVVLTRLLYLLQVVGQATTHPDRRRELVRHAYLIAEQANLTLHLNYPRQLVRQQLAETLLTLGEGEHGLNHLLQPVADPTLVPQVRM